MKYRIATIISACILAACGAGKSADQAQPEAKARAQRPVLKQNASSYEAVVQALYVAYFGRPADPVGLSNFEAALQAAGAPTDVAGLAQAYAGNAAVKNLVDSFGGSKESQSIYGGGTTANFVTAVYLNVLGRTPLPAGLSFWVTAIDSGSLSQGDAALAIMAGALQNTTSLGQIDAQLVENRIGVASFFTSQVAAFGLTSSYSGPTAAATARALLANVNSTTVVSTYQSTVTSDVAAFAGSGPVVEIFAGTMGGPGDLNGTLAQARFNTPYGVAMDGQGNVFVADTANKVIRKVTPDGKVTTLAGTMGVAGTADGTGSAAQFKWPTSLAVDAAGNLYVADSGAATIRKVTPAGLVTTLAGQGAGATFTGPLYGIAVDASGNVFVSDNCAIRKITPQGQVSTFAGTLGVPGTADGTGSAAGFSSPQGLAFDGTGNLYAVDNIMIRKITPGGAVTTIAGSPNGYGKADGNGTAAQFLGPEGIAVDGAGNVYVSEGIQNTIRRIDPAGNVVHYAGYGTYASYGGYADGAGVSALFYWPWGLCTDAQGNLYVADWGNSAIRKIDSKAVVSTYAGQVDSTLEADGTGSAAQFAEPSGIAFDNSGNLYVADTQGPTLRKVSQDGVVTTVSGTATPPIYGPYATPTKAPSGVVTDTTGNVYVADFAANTINMVAPDGTTTTAFSAGLSGIQIGNKFNVPQPQILAIDKSGALYFVDSWHYCIRKVTGIGESVIYAGSPYSNGEANDGPLAKATFSFPMGITFDAAGNLYVIDASTIRKLDTAGNVSTVAGSIGNYGYQDGNASSALFSTIASLAVDGTGNIYAADPNNNAIRKISTSGTVSTILGKPGAAGFVPGAAPGAEIASPRGLALRGNTLFVSMEKGILAVYNLPD